MNKQVILIGAGGNAKVIADIVIKCCDNLLGFLDDDKVGKTVLGFPVLGIVEDVRNYCHEAEFLIAIGNNRIRKNVAEQYPLQWYTAIHPTVQLGSDTNIGKGTTIMANAVVNASARVGEHCIINTGAVVEHDTIIGDFVHISPHATLCGGVKIGELTHIGASATVKNMVSVCSNVTVGAGGVVVKDISQSGTYVGVPAKWLKA